MLYLWRQVSPETDLHFYGRILAEKYRSGKLVSEMKKGADTMRLILKILVAPIIVVLTVFVWICALTLRCSAFVFGLAGTIVGILGVASLITDSTTNGIILLVIAFLVSPFGIPMAAAWLLGQIQRLRYAIQDKIFG